ncbi:unnamed protein product, partial [Ixodes hexagonus]
CESSAWIAAPLSPQDVVGSSSKPARPPLPCQALSEDDRVNREG